MKKSMKVWTGVIFALFSLIAATLGGGTAIAQDADGEGDDDVRPSPPSIGADIPVTYFGPPPSSVEPELIGDLQLLTAGTLNEDEGTITLPLYYGRIADSGESVYYIVTDTTDLSTAQALGLNHSSKLSFADDGRAVRDAEYDREGILEFYGGGVDFSPERSITPGSPNAFPPAEFSPGAVGDELYTPLVKILNAGGHVYNAPTMAFDVTPDQIDFCEGGVDHSLVHDSVVSICPGDEPDEPGTVTVELEAGFSFARPVLYMSTDTNHPLPAALEGAIFAPGLLDIQVGSDDSLFSPVERIFGWSNGPTNFEDGVTNPQRQGFESAVRGEGGPLNVLGGIPTIATDYSPLWDLNVGEWTDEAVERGFRSRLTEEFQILGFVERGYLTGPGGTPYGSSGFIINCPIVHRFL